MIHDLKDRLLSKVAVSENGCWVWTGSRTKGKDGYGQISVNGRKLVAHRLSYEIHVGKIPPGMDVLHNCPGGDNPACVNPAHLFVGSHADNMKDMVRKGRNFVRYGEESATAKLSDPAVRAIRQEAENLSGLRGRPSTGSHSITVTALAKKYGVSRRAIRFVIQGVTWRGKQWTGHTTGSA